MRKLKYNVYLNINDQEYYAIQDKLIIIEEKMKRILSSDNWSIKTPIVKSDGLNIDFYTQGVLFYGSLSITFQDQANRISFSMSVSKSFDTNNTRYLLRYYAFTDKEFDFFESNIEKFVSEALQKYGSWSKKDILDLGVSIKLG